MSSRQSSKQSNKGGSNTLFVTVCIGTAAVLLGTLLYARTYSSSKTPVKANKEEEKTEEQNDKTKGGRVELASSHTKGEEGTVDSMESGEATTQEDMKKQWNGIVNEAKELIRKEEYLAAAEKYSEALKLLPSIEEYANKTKSSQLLNNRSAMYEKAGEYARCILYCNLCLVDAPEHKLARIRKARVYESMGRIDDALQELCAHMIIEKRKEVEAKERGQPTPQFSVPPRLENVTTEATRKLVDDIQAKRDGEPTVCCLPNAQAMYDILRSFESYSKLEDEYGTMSEREMTERLQVASSHVEKVSTLMDRAMVRMLQRQYEDSEKDVAEAYSELEQAGVEEVGHEKAAFVLSWYGTFLYLSQVRSDAKDVFKRSCELDGLNPEVWVKLAGLALDAEDPAEAKRLFDRAIDLNVKYATTYLFRAQYYAFNGEIENAIEDLQTCIDLKPDHIAAYGRMVTMKIHAGDAVGAKSFIDASLEVAPNSSELNNTMGEYLYGMATVGGNAEDAMKSVSYFDKAIELDPKNPLPYLNKGLAVLYVQHNVLGAIELLEKALEVDPKNIQALTHIGQVKCSIASNVDEAEDASKIFDKAIEMTKDTNELHELCSLKVSIEARVRAARGLGLTNFPE